MKKFSRTLLSAMLMGLFALAHAEPASDDTAEKPTPALKKSANKPVNLLDKADVSPAPSAAPVNPFTGQPTTVEQSQRALESARRETELLNEQLKQATLKADMDMLPAKKKAELADIQKRGSNDLLGQGNTTANAKNAKKPAKKVEAKEAATEKPAAPQIVKPKVELTSVMLSAEQASALLTIDGATLVANHGEMTPLGRLEIIDANSVRVGGYPVSVHEHTLARMVVSDPKPVDPKAQNAFMPSVVPTAPGSPSQIPAPAGLAKSGTTLPPLLPPPAMPTSLGK